MEIINEFIDIYRKQIDFYDEVSRMVSKQLQERLKKSGIRSIITSRAKSVDKLRTKLENRNSKQKYKNFKDIYDDIVDLAGVRVALYFPDEIKEVDKIINDHFNLLEKPKVFPEDKSSKNDIYQKRFSGYCAKHYRVSVKDNCVSDEEKHYTEAKIEIQIASVLMHAWSEVEHDLVYKPYQGDLSYTERAILDELNGLVIAGEIALGRLQNAVEQRVKESNMEFINNYELSSYLWKTAKKVNNESMIGDVSVLFLLLQRLNINSPTKIERYVEKIDFESDRRTISQQIIDLIIEGNSEKYSLYESIINTSKTEKDPLHNAIGAFVEKWIKLEHLLRNYSTEKKPSFKYTTILVNIHSLLEGKVLNSEDYNEFNRLRRMRNNLVHGIEIPDSDYINNAVTDVDKLIEKIEKISNDIKNQ